VMSGAVAAWTVAGRTGTADRRSLGRYTEAP
jgi:hypothetical protein